MASLLNTMDADDFYKETYGGFEEEENDGEFAYNSPDEAADEVDSDFSIDENDEPKSDLEDEEGKAGKKAKRALGVQTKAYKEPKRNKDGSIVKKAAKIVAQPVKAKPRPQVRAVLLTEFGRKYTRASTVSKTAETAKRQKERVAEAKKLLKRKAKLKKKVEREMTQEEKLEEAKLTEQLNIESLKKYEQMELENKRKAIRLTKKAVHGPFIRYRSVAMPQTVSTEAKINVEEDEEAVAGGQPEAANHERTFLTFSDHATFRKAFPVSKRRLIAGKTCPITRLPAKYFDPVTQHPYANLQAFRILRETYYNQLELKGDKTDPEVAAWIEWRLKNKPVKPPVINSVSAAKPPQAFANLLALNNPGVFHQQRASISQPSTPNKLTGIIRATATTPGGMRMPIIQQQQQQKVHIQAGQQQQSIVLPVRTTPLTTHAVVTHAVTSVSFPVTSQMLTTTAALPSHPIAGTIQTVKIGGGQAQVLVKFVLSRLDFASSLSMEKTEWRAQNETKVLEKTLF